MFYQNVSRYALATHLALAAALPAALTQFVSENALSQVMLWVSLSAWIWIFVEPSVRRGETVSRAVGRVFSGMLRDPLSWFGLFAVVFAFTRWLNSGIATVYDVEKSIWSVCEPVAVFLPASSGDSAFFPLTLAIAITTVVLGVRHAIGKNARVWFGICAGALAASGAVAAVVCVGLGYEPIKASAMSGFGSGAFAGSLYALLLPMAVACGIEAEERNMSGSRLFFAWAVAGNAAGAFMFLPGLLGVGYIVLTIIILVISIIVVKRRAGVAAIARASSMVLLGTVMAALSVVLSPYSEINKKKISELNVEVAFPAELVDKNAALNRISHAMWLEHPWSGVGVGAFKLNVPFFAEKDDWSILPPEPARGSNSYFTMLSERGISGALVWVLGIGMLLWNWFAGLFASFRKSDDNSEGFPWFFTLAPVVWVGPIMLLAAATDAWFSNGFADISVALCVASSLALSAASFPRVRRTKEKKD